LGQSGRTALPAQFCVFGRVVDDGHRNEVARLPLVDVAPKDDLLTVRFDVVEEGLDLIELHLVLCRSDSDRRIEAIAELLLLRVVDKRLDKFLVEGTVDIETLDADTPLTRVADCPPNNCGMSAL